MKRTAKAIWEGSGKTGAGSLSTQSGVFNNQPYSARTRFENEDGKAGTNPEELIAAAHAGCFTMALSFQLQNNGFTATKLITDSVLTASKDDIGWKVDKITLNLVANVPEISAEQFATLAGNAKKNCPISRLLNCEIELNAKLA
ncbi:MAG: OsmC family protein [Saprospiraceae bacterium]|nr:OsmC family protein [Saprospiraceae bacterium]